jgi:DNA primase
MGKVDLGTTKYAVHARIEASGIVEKPDVVGAIFGQTEGLLGNDLDLRELQKTGRIGRIEVNIESKGGKSKGTIIIPSSLDKVETAILASALETIDRVGPCEANITVDRIEDVRVTKRKQVLERAKDILATMVEDITPDTIELMEEVKQAVRLHEIRKYGADKLPAGPNIGDSDAVIIVEGRADVLNLLKYGVKNAIAVEGTSIPKTIIDLTKQKTTTVFTDGDRGGELILRELLQVADIDFIARAPDGKEVEELTKKEIFKALRNKIPVEQIREGFKLIESDRAKTVSEVKRSRRREVKRVQRQKKEWSEESPVKADLSRSQAARYKEFFSALSGTLKAYLLDENNEVIKEVAVRDLAMALMNSKERVAGVIFDGVVTQRLVEIAGEKGIKYLVGAKIGTISKKPDNLELLTSADLGIEG